MAMKILDKDGLAYFWSKIKSWVTGRGYITSSGSITGNAGTATKLATARSISAGDLEFQGSANFDGSGNIALNVTNHRCIVTVGNTNYYPFHRIAYVPLYTGSWNDRGITFLVSKDYQGGGYGIARIIFRTNNVASQEAQCSVQWLCRTSDIAVNAIQVGFVKTAGASYLDVFYHSDGAYNSAVCRVIAHANARNGVGRGFTVVSASTEVNSTTATDPKTSVESYKTIADAGTALHNQAYTDIIVASDTGVVGSCVGNAATATRLAGPKHSYTTAANAAKNWYRIVNANTHQMDTSKPLQIQFMLTAWNPDQPADYYEQWFVDCQVYGRSSGIRIFGASGVPFSQARVLYENTVASIDTSDRPAIDIYLNYVLATACQIKIEEIYNSGWTFPADGVLAASTIPSGFENRAVGVQGSGVHQATNASYTTYTSLQRSNITANITLANSDTYRMRVLNCTNQITVTVPSIDNTYAWFLIKNFNAASTNKNVTIHPSTTSVLIDDSNADIVLKPGEWVIIASKAANSYTLISDGRWKSQKANKATTLAGYGITDAKIANGTITLGSSSITPLTSVPSHNQASSTINAMTGYSKPSSTSAIAATDSLNAAIGKLEKALDAVPSGGVSSVSATFECREGPVRLPLCFTLRLGYHYDDGESEGWEDYTDLYEPDGFFLESGQETKIATLNYRYKQFFLYVSIGDIADDYSAGPSSERSRSRRNGVIPYALFSLTTRESYDPIYIDLDGVPVGGSIPVIFDNLVTYSAPPDRSRSQQSGRTANPSPVPSELFGAYTVSLQLIRESDGQDGSFNVSVYVTAVSVDGVGSLDPVLTITTTESSGGSSSQEIDMSCMLPEVDENLSFVSNNPVENRAVAEALAETVHTGYDDQGIYGAKTFFQGPYGFTQTVYGNTLVLNRGTVFTKTITANTSFVFSGFPTGNSARAGTFTLVLKNGGSKTVTWPSSVKWAGGAAPSLTASGTDILTFFTPDGGTTWYGTVTVKGAA